MHSKAAVNFRYFTQIQQWPAGTFVFSQKEFAEKFSLIPSRPSLLIGYNWAMCTSVSKQEHWGEVDTALSHTEGTKSCLLRLALHLPWSKIPACTYTYACVMYVCTSFFGIPSTLCLYLLLLLLVSFPEWEGSQELVLRLRSGNWWKVGICQRGTCCYTLIYYL